MKKLLVASLALGSVLVLAGGCAHGGGGGGGGAGASVLESDCGLDSYYPYSVRHGFGHRVLYAGPCGSRGWEPSTFLQSPESAAPARAQIASPDPHRRPHPRFVDRPDDGSGFSRDASGSSGSSSSAPGGTVHLSQPSPTFSAPAPSSPPSSPPSPPASHAPPNR